MNSMRFVVDRVEEGVAICEELSDGRVSCREFRLCDLPFEVKEGDVLAYKNNKLTPSPEASHNRRELIKKLMDDVFEQL